MDLWQAFQRWIVVERRAPKTVESYRYSLLRLTRAGIVAPADATQPAVSRFVAERMVSSGVDAVKLDLAALCSVINYLVTCGEVQREQLFALRALRPRVRRPRAFHARFHNRGEVASLREAARQQDENSEFLVRLVLLSGLRAGEAARLPWSCVDLDRRVIAVRVDASLGALGRIKTMQERLVPICDELMALLAARPQREGYVFRHGPRASKNAHATVRTLRGRLRRARVRAGIPDASFHTLRHTRASWWIQAGVPLAKVALWMGNTPEVCSRYYAGLLLGYDPDCERRPAA